VEAGMVRSYAQAGESAAAHKRGQIYCAEESITSAIPAEALHRLAASEIV